MVIPGHLCNRREEISGKEEAKDAEILEWRGETDQGHRWRAELGEGRRVVLGQERRSGED